jgi:hypothetical protein
MQRFLPILLLVVVAFPAQAASPQGETTRVSVNNDPNQVVCRVERETGSLTRSSRVCRTRAQWDEATREVRRAVERAQNETQTSGQ